VRIFRSEDGAELREEDLRCYLTGQSGTDWVAAGDRIAAALAPRACGAVFVGSPNCAPYRDDFDVSGRVCVLPPGHHPYRPEVTNYAPERGNISRECAHCGRLWDDPIHALGHMVAPECWREP